MITQITGYYKKNIINRFNNTVFDMNIITKLTILVCKQLMPQIIPSRLNYKHGNTIKTLKGFNLDRTFNLMYIIECMYDAIRFIVKVTINFAVINPNVI